MAFWEDDIVKYVISSRLCMKIVKLSAFDERSVWLNMIV